MDTGQEQAHKQFSDVTNQRVALTFDSRLRSAEITQSIYIYFAHGTDGKRQLNEQLI